MDGARKRKRSNNPTDRQRINENLDKSNEKEITSLKANKEPNKKRKTGRSCTKVLVVAQKEQIKKTKTAQQCSSRKRQTTTRRTTKCNDTVLQISQKPQVNTKVEVKEQSKDFDLKEISKKHILQCISAIFHLTQEQLKDKNDLLAEEAQPIFMQVTCVRVPKVPRRQMRILLPYSVISSHDEIALFVCDLQRGRRKDYEPTVEHYRNLMDEHGCTTDVVKEIIPMNRVKTEFDQFELKRKLVASYDYFLVDGRIAGHMSHLLGKEFSKRRKLPTPIKMQSKDLKHEIDYALRKTNMHIHSRGDTHTMQIGNTSMDKDKVLENILAACKHLSKNYPGGWTNIRSLQLKSATSLALPFYMTLKDKNAVKPPVVRPKRPKAYRDVKGELSTLMTDTEVTVKPDGDIILEKKRARKNDTNKSED